MDNRELDDLSSRDSFARASSGLSESKNNVHTSTILALGEKVPESGDHTRQMHCFYTRTSVYLFHDTQDRKELKNVYNGEVPDLTLVYGVKEKARGK